MRETLLRPGAVGSVVGEIPLGELPRLLAACCLYIGNDSGPKHIAAALGIPTIGIHSGVVDPVEWGPVGRRAVALRRNMTCSPCYLAKAEDCPRSLACLRHLEPSVVHQTATMLLARPVVWVASEAPAAPMFAARRMPERQWRATGRHGGVETCEAEAWANGGRSRGLPQGQRSSHAAGASA